MKIKTNQFLDKLIWVLTVAWFSSFILFERVAMGRYLLMGFAVVIFLLSAYVNKGRFRLVVTPWHCFVAAFAVFAYISSLWALDPGDAIEKGTTIVLILICFSLVYMHYLRTDSVEQMIDAVKWAGFVVTIYTILFYGFNNVINMLNDEIRLNNKFSNVNTIGMLSAMAVVIQAYELTRGGKFTFSTLFSVPSIAIIAATQSRKALILAVIGIGLVFVSKTFNNEKNITAFFRTLAAIAISVLAMLLVLQLPIFAGILDRMYELVAIITGEGKAAYSATIRMRMIDLGWEQFLKHPVGGVGIGCSHILAANYLQFNTYLHNNYVELLSGGGMIGFSLFYGMYIYVVVNMFKYRSYADTEYWLCVIMIVLLLIMDYGLVSYYTKQIYFYFMLLFLEIRKLKKRSYNHATNEVDKKGKAISNG